MKIFFLFPIVFSCMLVIVTAEATPSAEEIKIKELSHYIGYLFWKDWKERDVVPLDMEMVLKGMKDAENGLKLNSKMTQEQLRAALCDLQEKLYLNRATVNLSLAEEYLKRMMKEPQVVEVVKDKLYYKKIKNGAGKAITHEDKPLFRISLKALESSGEVEMIHEDEPQPIELQHTITGFLKGVKGMLEGEKRVIYVHPDLGYGSVGRFEPNVLLIFEVEVIQSN